MQGAKTKTLTTIISLLCFAVLLCGYDAHNVGLYQGAPAWHRFIYMFCHANAIHCVLNAWAMMSVVFTVPISVSTMFFAFISAVCVPSATLGISPMVGMSGVVFFLLGSIIPWVSRKCYYLFLNASAIIFGALLANIAWKVHLWCFVLGLIYATTPYIKILNEGWKK